MRITTASIGLILTGLALGSGILAPAAISAQSNSVARLWVDNDRDYFRPGDRLHVKVSSSADSYLAVVHVDPRGMMEFVYPATPRDADFVRAGRVHSVGNYGFGEGLRVGSEPGIGYLYLIASPVPLDYSYFADQRGNAWSWYQTGQVSGDPFWAMEQIKRMLLPDWSEVPYEVSHYTYYVGGRHSYPSYACSSFGDGWGWGYSPAWASYYGACDRLDLFLRNNPYYFDSRRFRGDRRVWYRDYREPRYWDPRHAFKADPRTPAARAPSGRTARPSNENLPDRREAGDPRDSRDTRAVTPERRAVPRAAPEADDRRPSPAARTAPAADRGADRATARERPTPQRDDRPAARSAPAPRTPAAAPATRAPSRGASATPRSRRAD